MTRRLLDVQADFIEALQRPEAPVPASIAVRADKPAKKRFDVYRNNVAAGLTQALRATYPAIEKLVGEAFFAASARIYLERHPPRSPLLFRYGEAFGDFLDSFPPAAGTPYLGDVARLEWARLQAHHAADAEPLSIDALAAYLADGSERGDIGTLRFALHPSLDLITSRWPIVSLWAASAGQGSSDDVDMKRAERALVIRPSLAVETRALSPGAFAFLAGLRGDMTLQQAAIEASEAEETFDLAEHLQGLFAVGAVSAINKNTT
ncbi:MAG: DNA-binding domain-containing protein [Alphaproteobacteria bacterium]